MTWNMTKNKSATGKLFFWSTIYGKDSEHATPYQTRFGVGRLRFHIFHRGDADPDCHDHPWDFWTFPLTSYVEEIAIPSFMTNKEWDEFNISVNSYPQNPSGVDFTLKRQVVRAWRWHFRPAGHTHRVLGRWSGHYYRRSDDEVVPIVERDARIYTIVWRGPVLGRTWGFLKNRLGRWCRVSHKDYIWSGGKDAPCGD